MPVERKQELRTPLSRKEGVELSPEEQIRTLKEKLVDLMNGTAELRMELRKLEKMSQPETPQSPEDVTLENSYLIDPEKISEEDTEIWLEAIDRINRIPAVEPVNESELGPQERYAHRRQKLEKIIMSRFRRLKDGTYRMVQIALVPACALHEHADYGKARKLKDKFAKIKELLEPEQVEWYSQAEVEIFIDLLAKSDLPLTKEAGFDLATHEIRTILQKRITIRQIQERRDSTPPPPYRGRYTYPVPGREDEGNYGTAEEERQRLGQSQIIEEQRRQEKLARLDQINQQAEKFYQKLMSGEFAKQELMWGIGDEIAMAEDIGTDLDRRKNYAMAQSLPEDWNALDFLSYAKALDKISE